MPKLKIGTRGSPLALYQANETKSRLKAAHGLSDEDIEIVVITTTGDRIRDRPLSEIGGKGLFTKEIEEALFARDIHLAVHSMKDMPARLPDGLVMAALLPREDVRDAFLSPVAKDIDALPKGAVVGSSSVRRGAQLKRLRPDIEVIQFRGNVETRLKKLEEGVAMATFLAAAGLNRLGLADQNLGHNAPIGVLHHPRRSLHAAAYSSGRSSVTLMGRSPLSAPLTVTKCTHNRFA